MNEGRFDAIVIGGGHAGAEAVRVIARGGKRVAMVTMDRRAIGRMSCNPAIGGLAKGHLVKEIDALGGLMPEATDAAGIQFKVLNRSKGPAVQGPRAQCDRDLYAAAVQRILEAEPLVVFVEGCAKAVEVRDQAIAGVVLEDGSRLSARAVIVTTGTFLGALMHSGEQKTIGGRFGEPAATSLSDSLRALGLRLGRLKTGTPPRVARESADFEQMAPQDGDKPPRAFSILTDAIELPQVPCHITWTNEPVHELIRANLHRAPMYSGQIRATGPRYCPSIEDKVVRFAEKDRHQIFVEPEGLDHPWLYLNGISTSLPLDVQEGVVRGIRGLEQAVITRPGYAVEYDFVNPEQLNPDLGVPGIDGLYLAGQINGTSGYEEAAAQGLVAGLSSLQFLRGEEPWIPRRDEGYLGVMIDDLVTTGTEEPYRMFTSRAEHRLLLGCDTVYERLAPVAERHGVLDDERRRRIEARASRLARAGVAVDEQLRPDRETVAWMLEIGHPLSDPGPIRKLLQRPGFDLQLFAVECAKAGRLPELVEAIGGLREDEIEALTNASRYAGYIEKQAREASRMLEDESVRIPGSFDYHRPGLSREIVEKMSRVRPVSLGQAARVPGMTPAALSLLRMYLRTDGKRRTDSRGAAAPGSLQGAAVAVDGEDQPGRA